MRVEPDKLKGSEGEDQLKLYQFNEMWRSTISVRTAVFTRSGIRGPRDKLSLT